MSHPLTLFFGLEPETAFYQKMLSYKTDVYAAVGEQRYLQDSPHVTLYLAAFDLMKEVKAQLEKVAARMKAIHVNIDHI